MDNVTWEETERTGQTSSSRVKTDPESAPESVANRRRWPFIISSLSKIQQAPRQSHFRYGIGSITAWPLRTIVLRQLRHRPG